MIKTIETLSGKAVELNPADVGAMERLEEAVKVSSKSFRKLSKTIAKMTNDNVDIDTLKTMCSVVKTFVDTVFGEGAADRLFGGNNDVEELVALYSDVLKAFDEEGDRLTGVLAKLWAEGDDATAR